MLHRLQKSMSEKDKGFTLIELLVVVIIIGILAGIAIPVFLNQRKKGVDASLKSDLRNAASVVETWATDNPSTAVTAATASNTTAGTDTLAGFRASPGNSLKVKAGTDTGSYVICAWNSGATNANTNVKWMQYDSASGGITSTVGAC